MANYAATNGSSAGAGTIATTLGSTFGAPSVLSVGCSTGTPRRGKVYDVLVGTQTTPADAVVEWQIIEVTTVSTGSATGTSFAARKLDAADAAALSVCTANSTGSGTVVPPNSWYVGMNQRASYRWVAAPGSELVWPATASAGYTLQARGTSGIGLTATWYFQEQ